MSGSNKEGEEISKNESVVDEIEGLKRYKIELPYGLVPLNKRLRLSYPGVYPVTRDQLEEKLDQERIRNGFFDKYVVKNENVQGFQYLKEAYSDKRKLMNLGNFLVDVMNKKKTASQYQLPTVKPKVNKVIMNEEERISWMNEYCNSDNDYDSLALEVPAGLRIDHIIDRLSETNQSLSRCVWIIKLFILSEKSVKEKSTLVLSHEWTNLFIKILEKQILLIMKNTETENERVEKKFVSRWNYCIQVSKLLYDQDILDQKLFLRWLVESINNSIAKCALLLPLILSLLSEFSRSRALCIMKIRSLTSHHERLINNNDQNMFQTVFKAYCRTIIQITMLNFPDIFINSEISSSDKIDWNRIVNLPAHPLQDVIYKSLGFQLDSNKLKVVYQSIIKRNKNFEQKEIKKEITQQLMLKQDKEDFLKDFIPLKLGLNISNITVKAFSNTHINNYRLLSLKLNSFLNCFSKYLPKDGQIKYLASAMLKIWTFPTFEEKDVNTNNISLQSKSIDYQDLIQRILQEYLDNFDPCCKNNKGDSTNNDIQIDYNDNIDFNMLIELYSQFIRVGVFIYSKYLRSLMARGVFDLDYPNKRISEKHKHFMKNVSIYNSFKYYDKDLRTRMIHQSYSKHENDSEIEKMKILITRIKHNLTYLYNKQTDSKVIETPSESSFFDNIESDKSWKMEVINIINCSSNYIKGEVTSYLVKGVMSYFSGLSKKYEKTEDNPNDDTLSPINLEDLSTIFELMDLCNETGPIIELSIWILPRINNRSLIGFIINIFRYYQPTVIALGLPEAILSVLWEKYKTIKEIYGQPDKRLALYILTLITGNVPGSTNSMRVEIELYIHSLVPYKPQNELFPNSEVTEYIPELYNVSSDLQGLQQQASTLVSKFKHLLSWWDKLFKVALKNIHTKLISDPLDQSQQNLIMIRNYSDLFCLLSDFTLEGTPVVMNWILQFNSTYLRKKNTLESKVYYWNLILACFLTQRSIISVTQLCNTILNILELYFKQYTSVSVQDFFDKHFIFFLRLLFTSNYKDHLPNKITFDTQDYFNFNIMQGISFNSIESIEQVFKILYYICVIETLLQSNSEYIPKFQSLRNDIAKSNWMKTFVNDKFNSIYDKLMSDKGKAITEKLNKNIVMNQEQKQKTEHKFIELFVSILDLEELRISGANYFEKLLRDNKLTNKGKLNEEKVLLFQKNKTIISFYFNIVINLQLNSNSNSSESDYVSDFAKKLFFEWLMDLEIPYTTLIQIINSSPPHYWQMFLTVGGETLCGDTSSLNNKFPNYIKRWVDLLKKHKNQKEIIERYKKIMFGLLSLTPPGTIDNEVVKEWAKKRIEFGVFLIHQLKFISKFIHIFEIMTLSNCTFEQVSKLQLNNKIYEDTLSLNYDTNDTTTNNDGNDVNSEIIKEAIVIRVDLLIPCIKEMVDFVNLNIRMEWTEIFLGLLQNAVLIGEENKEEFEFILDFFSYYMNLIPKENKSELFSVLRKNYPKLTKTAINDPRIKRLFPFEAKSNYSSDIKNNTTDENEFIPWEWDNNLIKDGDNEIITKFNPIRLYHPNILATGPQINDTSLLITANNFKVVNNHSNSPFPINNSPFTTYDSPFTINNTRKLMKPRVAASPIGSIGITQSPLTALQSSLSQLAMSHSNKSNKDQANNKNEVKKSKE